MADADPYEFQPWLFWAPPRGKPERFRHWLRRYATAIRGVAQHFAPQEDLLLVAFLPRAVEIEALFYRAEGELENFRVSPLVEHWLTFKAQEEDNLKAGEPSSARAHLWAPDQVLLGQAYSGDTNLWLPNPTTLDAWWSRQLELELSSARRKSWLSLGLKYQSASPVESAEVKAPESEEALETAIKTLSFYIGSIQCEQSKLGETMDSFSSDLQASTDWARSFAANTSNLDGESLS